MPYDAHHDKAFKTTIAPVALGTTGTGQTGKIVDRKGFDSVEVLFSYGAVTATNATVTPSILEGDVTGTMTTVSAANLLGTAAGAGIAAGTPRTSGVNSKVTKRLGYIGLKRYVQAKLVNTVSAGIIAGAGVLMSRARVSPVAT